MVILLDQWGVHLAVLGMLLLTLFVAAVLNRYQAHQAVVRATVRRLDAGLADISSACDDLAGVPLSQELRVTLRGEILVRYQKVRRLSRRYPGIEEKVREAESAVRSQGEPRGGGVGPIESREAMHRLAAALDQLAGLIAGGEMVQEIPRDVRAIFCRELGERRAEVLARYHLVEANRFGQSGNIIRARGQLTTLMQLLHKRGPSTEFVRELYSEAEQAFAKMTEVELASGPAADGVDAV